MQSEVPLFTIEMFRSGWFGQSDVFWRWVETPATVAYAAAYTAMLQPPKRGARFDLLGRKGKPDLLAPEQLAQLTDSIEAQYGPSRGRAGAG